MMKNYLIRGNLQLVNNPGLGSCGIFATELILAKLEIEQRLQHHKDDADNAGKSSYRTRLSLRGNPGDHCVKCTEAMQYLINKAVGSEPSTRSYNIIQYWKDNPEVPPSLLTYLISFNDLFTVNVRPPIYYI